LQLRGELKRYEPSALQLLRDSCRHGKFRAFYGAVLSAALAEGKVKPAQVAGLALPPVERPEVLADLAVLEAAWRYRSFFAHPEYRGVSLLPGRPDDVLHGLS
jgi:hypothetical protein